MSQLLIWTRSMKKCKVQSARSEQNLDKGGSRVSRRECGRKSWLMMKKKKNKKVRVGHNSTAQTSNT